MPESNVATTFFKHPDWMLNHRDWIVTQDLFEGFHDILTREEYLWRHELELDHVNGGGKLRVIRERRSRYTNYIRSVVKRYVSIIFKNEPDISDVVDLFGDEIDDVDGRGNHLLRFIKNIVAETYFLYGAPYILVDSFGITAGSLQEEKELGHRPFMEVFQPLEVTDWEVEGGDPARKGRLNFLRCEFVVVEPRESAEMIPVEFRYTKLLERNEEGKYQISVYRGSENKTDPREQVTSRRDERNEKHSHNFGERHSIDDDKWVLVSGPLVVSEFDEIPVSFLKEESWVKEVVPLCLLKHNTQSALDNVLLYQAFQRIMVAGRIPEEGKSAMSEYVITFLPEGASVTVIDPADTSALEKRNGTLAGEIFRTAFFQSRVMPADSRGVEAAATQREAKEEFLAAMINASQNLEHLMNNAFKAYAKFKGINDFDGEIRFEKDITMEDVSEQMALARAHWDVIQKHPTWRKEVNKKIAKQQNLDNVEDIITEIEDAPEPVNSKLSNLNGERANIFTDVIDGR